VSRVAIGAGVRAAAAGRLEALGAGKALVAIDENVARLFGPPLDAPQVVVPAGEASKSIDGWRRLLDACVAQRLDRDSVVVAVGGGVTLDLAGFAAAAYLRGIRWIALPTTLLAQVDAAYGGKTGVDHPAAKNLVGAFHPPEEVLADSDYLATLPGREIRCGLAEVVKHAVVGAPSLLDRCGVDEPATLVPEAARVKIAIVERDPRERYERLQLNLGHTIGHAIERATDFRVPHGEAVAVGLRAAARIAERHCGFRGRGLLEAALDRCGLPRTADAEKPRLLDALLHDKKRAGGRLRWVLPVALGEVRVFADVPDDLVSEALTGTAEASR